MKYKHEHIAKQHIKLKQLFIEFTQLSRAYVEKTSKAIFVISSDGFNSQDFIIHGRRVRFLFELVFKTGGMPIGQLETQLIESESDSQTLDTLQFDNLGNILSEDLSLHNITHSEGCVTILYQAADRVVDSATK